MQSRGNNSPIRSMRFFELLRCILVTCLSKYENEDEFEIGDLIIANDLFNCLKYIIRKFFGHMGTIQTSHIEIAHKALTEFPCPCERCRFWDDTPQLDCTCAVVYKSQMSYLQLISKLQ